MYAGFNFRMSAVSAAIGLVQLGKLERMNEARRRIAGFYSSSLPGDLFVLPVEAPLRRHVFQMYTVRVRNFDRDEFVSRLASRGVAASVHYSPPVHRQPYYADAIRAGRAAVAGDLRITDEVSKSIVSLPIYPALTLEQASRVVEIASECARDLTR